jgi:hypothetical protein
MSPPQQSSRISSCPFGEHRRAVSEAGALHGFGEHELTTARGFVGHGLVSVVGRYREEVALDEGLRAKPASLEFGASGR